MQGDRNNSHGQNYIPSGQMPPPNFNGQTMTPYMYQPHGMVPPNYMRYQPNEFHPFSPRQDFTKQVTIK